MARPKIKRNRKKNYVFIPAADVPVDEVLRLHPLPQNLQHLLPVLRGPLGQTMLNAIATCHEEGFSRTKLAQVVTLVADFYAQDYHRCNACLNWTAEPIAGALVTDGRFIITALCPNCAKLGSEGRHTANMARNMQDHVFGGAE